MVFGSAEQVSEKMPENGAFCDYQPVARTKSGG